jgi:hypothetical protein
MPMPKAAVDEDYLLELRKDDVRSTGQILSMEAKTVS